MFESKTRLEDGTWEVCDGIVVKCSLDVLEEVRRLAVDGLNSCTHGGRETGGILYGIHEEGCIRVLSFAELACEHALGPRFLLSEKDRSALANLLQPPAELEMVGWFRAHTRSGLELDAHDQEMFNQYFVRAMSLALIVQPTRCGPASAAFYVREYSGEVAPAGAREFAVEPREPPAARPVSPEAEPSTGRELEAVYECAAPPSFSAQNYAAPIPGLTGRTPKARRGWAWAFCAAAILGIVAAFTYGSRPSRRIDLQAHAIAPGQVFIKWRHRPQAVLKGASGVLEIEDGDLTTRLPLDTERIRSGTVTYGQRTSHITVRFRVDALKPGAAPTEDAIEFAGVPVALTPPSEIRRDPPRAVEAKVSPGPSPRVQVTRQQLQMAIGTTPIPTRREKPIRKAILAGDANRTKGVDPVVLPGPPAVEPAPPRPIGLPEFLSNPPLHTSAPLPPSVKTAAYGGPRSGRLIWTGFLGRRGVIEMDGPHVSVGSVTGALPGVALSVRVSRAEFSRDGLIVYTGDRARAGISEAPARLNGWNAVHYKFDDARARELVVLEAPNRSNDFTRLVLRNEGRDCSVVVVDWSVP